MKILAQIAAGNCVETPEPASRSIRQGSHVEAAPGRWINIMVEDAGLAICAHGHKVFIPTSELLALAETHSPGITKSPPSKPLK